MTRSADEMIMALAARQHGLVTRSQLLDAGVAPDRVKYRVKNKRLQSVQRGVYQVGPLASPKAREMAAALACGPDAVVSHRSAAILWQLLPSGRVAGQMSRARTTSPMAPVDVTVPISHRCRRPGVCVHRAVLRREEVTKVDHIPITVPARTLLDLASVVRQRVVEQALAQAEREGLAKRPDLSSLIERHRRRPGVPLLRALMDQGGGPALARSEAEERFLALVRKAPLPAPELNVRVGGFERDFYWRSEGVVVEVDGFAFHSSAATFERDRQRDAELASKGMHVIRVTWRQIVREPEVVLVQLAQTLARAADRYSRQVGT